MQVSVREVTPSQHTWRMVFSFCFLQIFRSQIFDYVAGESFLFPLRSWPRRHTAEVSPVLFGVSMFDERLYLMRIFNMLVGMNVVFLIFYWWAVCFAASDIKQTIEIHFGGHTVIMRMLDMMQRRHECTAGLIMKTWDLTFCRVFCGILTIRASAAPPSFSSLWLQTCWCQTDHTLMICHEGPTYQSYHPPPSIPGVKSSVCG